MGSQNSEISGVIDFEWAFIGDPMWDVGYLKYWLDSDERQFRQYTHPREVWKGFKAGYNEHIDLALVDCYANLTNYRP